MITAKNYAAQAENGLNLLAKTSQFCSTNEQRNHLYKIADKIKKSVHFVAPDSGVIFDDKGKGLQNKELQLPFETITIEYFCPSDTQIGDDILVVNKRLILAEKVTHQQALLLNPHIHKSVTRDYYIYVTAIFFYDGFWIPLACGALVIPDWDNKGCASDIVGDSNNTGVSAIPVEILKWRIQGNIKDFMSDIAGELGVLIEILEALSCTNVESSIHQAASPKNAKRIKSHKLPIYETKFLTIKAGKSQQSNTGNNGTHASPRQHLRRGHIRRLETGNIWVNSCVVGSKENGVIDKQYRVTV